uniref:SRA stem-loop interacting RNA binding protein n=1 Tax=Erpetoichthys calabaricus TaxID=27687 RepID=A0A8C4TK53_ERPCA
MSAASRKAFEVFVSKIPWTVATKELKEYFGQFGNVRKCLLLFDKETGFHRGLRNALQKDPHVLEGTKLLVQRNRKVVFERRDK